jgi:hypothetical protein
MTRRAVSDLGASLVASIGPSQRVAGADPITLGPTAVAPVGGLLQDRGGAGAVG